MNYSYIRSTAPIELTKAQDNPFQTDDIPSRGTIAPLLPDLSYFTEMDQLQVEKYQSLFRDIKDLFDRLDNGMTIDIRTQLRRKRRTVLLREISDSKLYRSRVEAPRIESFNYL